MRISEQAIERLGDAAVSAYAYVAIRCINGAVYRYEDARVRKRFGWGRSKFYKAMNLLVRSGLAERQECGNWRLRSREEVSGGRHRCHLLVSRKHDERAVKDMVALKLVEMAHRQVSRAIMPRSASKMARAARNEMISAMERNPRIDPTMISEPALGEGRSSLVKRVADGYAPMNTEKLMRVTGLGRGALFAWKRRVKERGWIEQVDRKQRVHPSARRIPDGLKDAIEREFRGRFSEGRSDPRIYFHQASCYRLLLTYGR